MFHLGGKAVPFPLLTSMKGQSPNFKKTALLVLVGSYRPERLTLQASDASVYAETFSFIDASLNTKLCEQLQLSPTKS